MATSSVNALARTPQLLMAFAELLILSSSLYVAALATFGSIADFETALGPLAPRAAIVTPVFFLSLVAMGIYQFHRRINFRDVIIRIGIAFGAGFLLVAVFFLTIPNFKISIELASVSIVYAVVSVLLVRYLYMLHVDNNIFRRRTLIYGAGKRSESILNLRRRADRRGFRVVGAIPAPGDSQSNYNEMLMPGDKSITELAVETRADEIVVAMDDRRGFLPVVELLECRTHGIEVLDLLEFLERETGKIHIDLVRPGWLIFARGFRRSRLRDFIKRVGDIVASVLLLLVFLPIILFVAVAIKIEDGWRSPILYRQTRAGRNGIPIEVLKFRSMHVNAESDGQAVWASQNDNRITRVGRLARKYRLDEFPQLINVLRGDMSVIGPRPERPEFVRELTQSVPYYGERHVVKPGLTGWAQLKYQYGASENDAAEKLKYELYYVKNHNLLLDVMILLQTAEVILWGQGAR